MLPPDTWLGGESHAAADANVCSISILWMANLLLQFSSLCPPVLEPDFNLVLHIQKNCKYICTQYYSRERNLPGTKYFLYSNVWKKCRQSGHQNLNWSVSSEYGWLKFLWHETRIFSIHLDFSDAQRARQNCPPFLIEKGILLECTFHRVNLKILEGGSWSFREIQVERCWN